jgi:arsenate reductase
VPVRIYHNKRCSKSRAACQLIADSGVDCRDHRLPGDPAEPRRTARRLLRKLGMQARELVRRGEAVFKEHYAGRSLSDEEWLDALLAHPILIERPIVVRGDGRCSDGRPRRCWSCCREEASRRRGRIRRQQPRQISRPQLRPAV